MLVTGSTDGIGLATARLLGAAGARVLVHGRNQPRVEAALASLRSAVPAGDFDGVWFDLGTMSAVRRGAADVAARAPRLDVLLHNAGIFASERLVTADGFELTLAVNYVGPLLLTELVPADTVINVSSIAHMRGDVAPDDLAHAQGFTGYAAYARSKLAQVMHALSLADAGRRAFSLHPGVINTKLLREGFGPVRGDTVDNGAAMSVRLALASVAGRGLAWPVGLPALDLADVPSGTYFGDGRATPPAVKARDAALRAQLSTAVRSHLGLPTA